MTAVSDNHELADILTAALNYAEAGYYVFPVSVSIDPDSGKKNTRHYPGWREASTRDLDKVRSWYTRYTSWTGVAIDCGKSGVVVVDLDVKGDVDGVSAWDQLPTQQDTRMRAQTQSGGQHWYYQDPSGTVTNSASEVAPGVDIRGTGGLVYAAPTPVDGGGSYSLTGDLIPVTELPALTDEMVRLITARQGKSSTALVPHEGPFKLSEDRAQAIIHSRLDRLSEGSGMRDAIFGVAVGISQFESGKAVRDGVILDQDSLTQLIENTILPLVPWDSLNADDAQWIEDGVAKGMVEPWEIIECKSIFGDALAQVNAYQPLAERLTARNCTESANAERLAEYVTGFVYYVSGLGWLVWNGKVWEQNEGAVKELVRMFNKLLWDDLAEVAKVSESGPKSDQLRFVQSMNRANAIAATIDLLKNMPGIAVQSAASFDANPFLLSVDNGTVDLRDGSIQPHDRDDRITLMIPIEYHPNVLAPRWDRFLSEVFPNQPDTPAFLQRLFGYALTGLNQEHIFPVLNGRGRNGKSVMLDVVSHVFGPFGTKVLRGAFDADAGSTKETELASLRGKRLALLSETNDSLVMDEALVKEATGDGTIKARHLYGRSFEFPRTFQLVMVTNHRPDFRSQGEALWDRVRLIEFERYFSAEEREKGLDQYLITHEAEGILAWLVRGAIEYFRVGLAEPECVLSATRKYQAETDKLAEFLGEECVVEPRGKVLASTLWSLYQEWASRMIGKPDFRGNRTFYAALGEKGYEKALGTGGKQYVHGLRLIEYAERGMS